MSVESVQAHNLDQVATPPRRPVAADSAQAAASGSSREAPRDEVVVSDEARQLAAGAQPSPAQGTPSNRERPRLQLDFRQLRALAFRDQPKAPAETK